MDSPILKNVVTRTVVALWLAAPAWPVHAEEGSIEALRTRTDGVYILEEWHKDGQVFKPPQVEGRFVFQNGVIMTILHNRMQPPNEVTFVLVGRYTLDSTSFSYAYDNTSVFTEGPSGVDVSHKPRWEGSRKLEVSYEDGVVHMRSEGGQQEFFFDAAGLNYYDGGKLLRVWRRTTKK